MNKYLPNILHKQELEVGEEFEYVNSLFPNALFNISLLLSELDEVVSNNSSITIEHSFTCSCYDLCSNNLKQTKYYIVTGIKLTNGYILDELIKQEITCNCDHCIFDGFKLLSNGHYSFDCVSY